MGVLITGGNGFIGKNLTNSFIEDGEDITIYGDGEPSKNVNYISGDILDIENHKFENVDSAIHLVGIREKNWSSKTEKINVLGTVNFFEMCRKNDINNIIFFSSSSVYGPSEKIISEEVMPNPESRYGLDKYICELYAKKYHEDYGLKTIIFRPSNVYGSGQYYNDFSNFITKAIYCNLKEKNLDVFNNGNIIRDYIHVKDLYAPVKEALKIKKQFEVYNLACGVDTSVNEIIETIEKFTNKKMLIENKEINAPEKISLSIEKISRDLNFKPKYNLEKGIYENLDWGKNIF